MILRDITNPTCFSKQLLFPGFILLLVTTDDISIKLYFFKAVLVLKKTTLKLISKF